MTKEQLQKLDAIAKPRSEEAVKKAQERKKQREKELNIKVTIEIDGSPNIGCKIESDGEIQQWEELDKYQQIQVVNSLGQFYTLFYKHFKGNEK